MNMEESLLILPKDTEDQRKLSSRSSTTHHLTRVCFFEEVKRQCYIAGPMVAVILSQNLLRIVSMMMVGHLGELALSSSSIAISLTGVTGFSLFVSDLNLNLIFFSSHPYLVSDFLCQTVCL